MCPSFGVPWLRLDRAVARLKQLYGTNALSPKLQPIIFLCGLKYLVSYRDATNRRMTHYVDDGLREAVDSALPILMETTKSFRLDQQAGRLRVAPANAEFEQLRCAFLVFEHRLPIVANAWVSGGRREAHLVRLVFGMGVAARFSPCSHSHVRAMLRKPLKLPPAVLDVVESFHWDAEWSVALRA